MQGTLSKAHVLSENDPNNLQNFEHLQIITLKMYCCNRKYTETDNYRFYKRFQNTFFCCRVYIKTLKTITKCNINVQSCMCGSQRNKGTSRKTQSEGVETESGEHCRQDGPSKRKERDLKKRRGRKTHGEVRQTQTNWRGEFAYILTKSPSFSV